MRSRWTSLTIAVSLGASACGSEISAPPGYYGTTTPDAEVTEEVVEDVAQDMDAAEAGCQTDDDCEGRFALYPCQLAVCDTAAGKCKVGAEPDGTPCDDKNVCTEGEACSTGICVPESNVSCDDDNPCTTDSCDDGTGCVHTPDDTQTCSDGELCTIGDQCSGGECVGTPTAECFSGSCCAANETPGCDDAAVRECVCEQEPGCCALDGSWNKFCADQVQALGCGICPIASCADGECTVAESCSTCPGDCGFCADCGDGVCGDGETCFSCHKDCGECANAVCGDKVCTPGKEDCLSCKVDCGECTGAVCGDGTCELGENCQTCSADCGECPPGCGDGVCTLPGEGCENCPIDCGVCVGDCCTARDEPGCDQQLIQDCVCEEDDFCCTDTWDGVCVAQVSVVGCASCDAIQCGDGTCHPDEDCATCEADCGKCPECGDGKCDEGESCDSCESDCGECASLCCEPQGGPGCGDPAIESCVCAFDSFCCNNTWDSTCAGEVESLGCGTCGGGGGGPGNGACCSTSSGAGCPGDPSTESCVCGIDFLCCFFSWDSACVDIAANQCNGGCP